MMQQHQPKQGMIPQSSNNISQMNTNYMMSPSLIDPQLQQMQHSQHLIQPQRSTSTDINNSSQVGLINGIRKENKIFISFLLLI